MLVRNIRRAPVACGLAAFTLYALTSARGVGWDDSGEFAVGVTNLGIVHPTGYPGYLLAAKALQIIDPIGSDAEQVNHFSVLVAALAVALIAHYVQRLTASTLAACVAALLLGTGGLFWQHATTASQYPVYICATLALLIFADRWAEERSPGNLACLAAAAGLVAVSHRTGLVFAAAAAAFVAWESRAELLRARNGLAVAAALVPLATIAYLPLRAEAPGFPNYLRDQHMTWWALLNGGGDPDARLLGASTAAIQDHLMVLFYLLHSELSLAAFALLPLGGALLLRNKAFVWCGLLPVLVISAAVVTTPAAFPHWHFPLLVIGAALAGTAAAALVRHVAQSRQALRFALVGILVASIAAVPAIGGAHLRHGQRDASPWARETLRQLPPGAKVLAPWPAFSSLRAIQELEGLRLDVRIAIAPDYRPSSALVRAAGASHIVVIRVEGQREFPASELHPVGPVAGVQVRGMTELRLGPKLIGLPELTARLYRVPR